MRSEPIYGRAAFDRTQNLAGLAEALPPHLEAAHRGVRFAFAFADLAGPSLPDVLDALAAEGVDRAVVVPCMVPADPTLSTWLAGAPSQWHADRGTAMSVSFAPPIEQVLDLVAAIVTTLGRPASDVTLTAPSLGKPGWSKVPEHGRQVFLCVGARCLHRGAEPLYQHLRARMKAHRPLTAGPRLVMCARSSCLYPCNLGPLMTVHPEGVWYGGMIRTAIDRIMEEHLIADRPVSDCLVHVQAAH